MRLLFLIFLFSVVRADNGYYQKPMYLKVNDTIAGSSVGSFFNGLMNNPLTSLFQRYIMNIVDDMPVDSEYQALALEAQKNLGVKAYSTLPIMRLNNDRRVCKDDRILAIAESNYILVNQDIMKNVSYGIKRVVLHHEAVHVKYNDKTSLLYPILMTALAQEAVLSKVPFYSLVKLRAFLFLTYASPLFFDFKVLPSMIERRADVEGCYATQCEQCVGEFADYCSDSRSASGYLNKKEIRNIADDLKGKRCDAHERSILEKGLCFVMKNLK